MTERSVYVAGLGVKEALSQLLAVTPVLAGEEIPTRASLGRVTAEPICAVRSVPHYPAAAMDGIAVRSRDTVGASETNPVAMRTRAMPVDTGDPLPADTDAVIMCEVVRGEELEIDGAAAPWQHVRPIGEDMVAGDIILARGMRIRPLHLGALLSGGPLTIRVRRRPLVAIIPTGDEMVTAEDAGPAEPESGRIVESNSAMLSGLVAEDGAEPLPWPIVPDDPEQLRKAIRGALRQGADLVLINAGSSAGRGDFTPDVIASLGTLFGRGLTIRPGKPASFGHIGGVPVIGLPGYPVSTATVYDLLARPVLATMLGTAADRRPRARATLVRHVASSMGVTEFLRVRLGVVGQRVVAVPLGRGAGATMSLVRADGLLVVPPHSEGLADGSEVEVELLRPWSDIQRTVLAVGSHDLSLDIMDDILRDTTEFSLQAAAIGSLGGIIALSRGEAHVAGCHLLDEESGDFNLPFVARHVPEPVLLITIADRQQGLVCAPQNPLRIGAIADVARDDVRYINRQRGSGTRLLLDHELRRHGIDPAAVSGYGREEFTHTAVAAAVRAGVCDCGLAILAAARAMGLEFVPVATERYELAIPLRHLELGAVAAIRTVLKGDRFRQRLLDLGGYDVSRTGSERIVGQGGCG